MSGSLSIKQAKEEFKKIANAFRERDKKILTLKNDITSKNEMYLMIKKALREQLREVTTRSTSPNQLKPMQKRVLKRLDTAKIMKAIHSYIQEGYRTNQIKDEIINRFGIKPTCFFKYLKALREQLREVTTRSTSQSLE